MKLGKVISNSLFLCIQILLMAQGIGSLPKLWWEVEIVIEML